MFFSFVRKNDWLPYLINTNVFTIKDAMILKITVHNELSSSSLMSIFTLKYIKIKK